MIADGVDVGRESRIVAHDCFLPLRRVVPQLGHQFGGVDRLGGVGVEAAPEVGLDVLHLALVSLMVASARMRRTASKPFLFGITTSIRIIATFGQPSTASSPSFAVMRSYGPFVRILRSVIRIVLKSSKRRIFLRALFMSGPFLRKPKATGSATQPADPTRVTGDFGEIYEGGNHEVS